MSPGWLVINGHEGLDTINLSDLSPELPSPVASTLEGLGLEVPIHYLGLEELNIWLGFGANTFHINSTHGGETTLNTAEGGDTVNVNHVSGLVTVNAEEGDDFVNVRATGLGSELRINGHEGLDTINLSDDSPTLPAPYPAVQPPPARTTLMSR